jgi:hypothetical protein
MHTAGIILGALGAICVVVGILTAVGVMPLLGAQLNHFFWFALGGLLILSTIAFNTTRGGGGEY